MATGEAETGLAATWRGAETGLAVTGCGAETPHVATGRRADIGVAATGRRAEVGFAGTGRGSGARFVAIMRESRKGHAVTLHAAGARFMAAGVSKQVEMTCFLRAVPVRNEEGETPRRTTSLMTVSLASPNRVGACTASGLDWRSCLPLKGLRRPMLFSEFSAFSGPATAVAWFLAVWLSAASLVRYRGFFKATHEGVVQLAIVPTAVEG